MAQESIPWPLRWIVDEDRRDTGFATLRRSIGHGERPAFESMAAEHRFVGFTHFGPFPLYHEAYDGRRPGRTPLAGWERPEVRACEAWAHCFRDPDRYLPPDPPRMLVSGSDSVHERAAWRERWRSKAQVGLRQDHDEVHAKWIKLQTRAKEGPIPTTMPTLTSYLAHWLREVVEPNLAPKTTERYALLSRLYLIPGTGPKRLDRLQARDIRPAVQRVLDHNPARILVGHGGLLAPTDVRRRLGAIT